MNTRSIHELNMAINPHYNQITIDMMESVYDELMEESNDTIKLECFKYKIDILLEVFNPKYIKDINFLKELHDSIELELDQNKPINKS